MKDQEEAQELLEWVDTAAGLKAGDWLECIKDESTSRITRGQRYQVRNITRGDPRGDGHDVVWVGPDGYGFFIDQGTPGGRFMKPHLRKVSGPL